MNQVLAELNQNAMLIPVFMHGLAIFIMLTVGALSMLKKQKICDKRYLIWGRVNHTACAALLIWVIATKGYDRLMEFLCLISFVLLLYLLLLLALIFNSIKIRHRRSAS